MLSNTSITNDISILKKIKCTLSESFEKCPRSANIASAPEIAIKPNTVKTSA
jgi:hypothetical protein